MGKPIFVVTHGEHSDYKIIGVFSTQQNAETFIVTAQGAEDMFSDNQYRMNIEVYDLDKRFTCECHSFEVVMQISTRKIESVEFEEHGELWMNDEPFTTDGGTTIVWRGMRTKGIDYAVKVANERVSAMIASGMLVPVFGKDGVWELRKNGVKA